MRTLSVTADFRPTIYLRVLIDPMENDTDSQAGFLLLESGDRILLEDGGRIFLENSIIPILSDTTVYTADDTDITADATFLLNAA